MYWLKEDRYVIKRENYFFGFGAGFLMVSFFGSVFFVAGFLLALVMNNSTPF